MHFSWNRLQNSVPDDTGMITDLLEGALHSFFFPTSDMQQRKKKDETEKEVKVNSEQIYEKNRKRTGKAGKN